MLRIAICDDEAIHRMIMKDYILYFSILTNIEVKIIELQSTNCLKNNLHCCDILFLDTNLENNIDGIELACMLRKSGFSSYIIFMSWLDYAIKGYRAGAIRYLIKPISQSDVMEALSFCVNDNNQKKIKILDKGELHIIDLDEILFIESYNRKRTIHLIMSQDVTTTEKLYKIAEMLPSSQFVYIQKSQIINISKVKKLVANSIILENNTVLSMSRRKKEDVKKIICSV